MISSFLPARAQKIDPNNNQIILNDKIKMPGTFQMIKLSALKEAIDYAGGTKIIKGKVSFLSMSNIGLVEKIEYRHSKSAKKGSYKNPYLSNNSAFFIGRNFLSSSIEVINEISELFKGIFSTYCLFKVLD